MVLMEKKYFLANPDTQNKWQPVLFQHYIFLSYKY